MLSLDGVAFVVLAREARGPRLGLDLGDGDDGLAGLVRLRPGAHLDAAWFPAATQTWRHRFRRGSGWTLLAIGAGIGAVLFLALAWADPAGLPAPRAHMLLPFATRQARVDSWSSSVRVG
jgi:hypothetical protein